ncbi:hypothetical protein PRIPAC_96305 [Pristionchus pacificus]|uniref:Uncharacterized protein n=1 Tax=Pristionchus pacificus TaxID=54126 RepID=A0A2A6CV38_PRIPA|nr:hypothetical protein PRIPAC_96305 [Pristionchus pacificus]|eukprot:PDM81907.1 hypothetical protein PRIPAC_34061 [Pristionchus pacificus]
MRILLCCIVAILPSLQSQLMNNTLPHLSYCALLEFKKWKTPIVENYKESPYVVEGFKDAETVFSKRLANTTLGLDLAKLRNYTREAVTENRNVMFLMNRCCAALAFKLLIDQDSLDEYDINVIILLKSIFPKAIRERFDDDTNYNMDKSPWTKRRLFSVDEKKAIAEAFTAAVNAFSKRLEGTQFGYDLFALDTYLKTNKMPRFEVLMTPPNDKVEASTIPIHSFEESPPSDAEAPAEREEPELPADSEESETPEEPKAPEEHEEAEVPAAPEEIPEELAVEYEDTQATEESETHEQPAGEFVENEEAIEPEGSLPFSEPSFEPITSSPPRNTSESSSTDPESLDKPSSISSEPEIPPNESHDDSLVDITPPARPSNQTGIYPHVIPDESSNSTAPDLRPDVPSVRVSSRRKRPFAEPAIDSAASSTITMITVILIYSFIASV